MNEAFVCPPPMHTLPSLVSASHYCYDVTIYMHFPSLPFNDMHCFPSNYKLCFCIFLTEPPKPLILCDPPTLPDFMEHVAFHIQAKWYNFGLMLDVPSDALECYQGRYRGDQLACLERVFEAWFKVDNTKPFHWSSVVTALKSKVVAENVLAARIQERVQGY